jgi:DNA gyrase subunit B
MLSSQEIRTLITALGAGIGKDGKDLAKLRYQTIVIMTDADVDGSHIRTLLLTFFYRQFEEFIEQGYLYIAQPPLFKVRRGKQERYLQDEAALEDYLIELGTQGVRLESNGTTLTGMQLKGIVKRTTRFEKIMDVIERKKRQRDIVQAVVAVEEDPHLWLRDPERVNAVAQAVQRHLEAIGSDLLPVSFTVEEDPERQQSAPEIFSIARQRRESTHGRRHGVSVCSPEFEELRRLAGELRATGAAAVTLTIVGKVVNGSVTPRGRRAHRFGTGR